MNNVSVLSVLIVRLGKGIQSFLTWSGPDIFNRCLKPVPVHNESMKAYNNKKEKACF